MSRVVCDVVIIGAGVMGCSAAFHLARQRNLRVIVVEKGSLASGMTKRSGAFIHTHFADETEARLAQTSFKYYQNWKNLVGANCGFTSTGLIVTASASDEVRLRDEVAQLASLGINSKTISLEELAQLQPHVHIDDISIAAYEPDAGYADPVLTTQSLAARAKELGVTFKTGTLVKDIRVNLGRVSSVETTTGNIETQNIVVMTGPWTDRLLKPLGVQIGITNTRASIAFFDRPADLKPGHAAFIDYATGAHFRPHTYGLTMVGLNRSQSEEQNPDAFDENVLLDMVDHLRRRLATRFPMMANARYVRGHAGIYDATLDAKPVISRVPGIAGLIVAAGFSGKGSSFAPAVGACVAEMVTEGEARTVNVKELELRD